MMLAGTGRRTALVWLGIAAFALFAATLLLTASADQGKKSNYGGKEDVELAIRLWRQLKNKKLVGKDRINVHAFKGKRPHGPIQQVYASTVTVNGHRGRAVVKANHKGKNLLIGDVYDEPNRYLADYTVMFVNEKGYDPENGDWFWVLYKPDGRIGRSATGAPVAGRVGKDEDFGCIGCHRAVGGEDLEALTSE